MLKSQTAKKFIIGFSALLLTIGIVLVGSAIAMGGQDFSYLKTDDRRWYQLVSIDENNNLSIGTHFGDSFRIGGGEINLNPYE